VTGQGAKFFALACKRGLEGIVSKRAKAPYRSGRSGDWQKVKCKLRQEFVIGGYRYETTGRPNLGSLLIGYFDRGRLIYAGSVGTGWSIQLGRSIMASLQRLSRDTLPFVAVPRPDAKDAHWAEPKIVCEVEFTQWTRDGAGAAAGVQGVPGGQGGAIGQARGAEVAAGSTPLGKRSL
jgi:bifunctional non-homologous end joining protein LigD